MNVMEKDLGVDELHASVDNDITHLCTRTCSDKSGAVEMDSTAVANSQVKAV